MRLYHETIRELRQGSGLKQADMALWLSISPVDYARLESGRAPMTVDQLLAIAERLVVTPGDLLDGDAA